MEGLKEFLALVLLLGCANVWAVECTQKDQISCQARNPFVASIEEHFGGPRTQCEPGDMARVQPITILEGILTWTVDTYESNSIATIPYTGPQTPPHRPRTLVCHDMAGGYLHDSFIQGVDTAEVYRFFHWSQVDTFVYFSHSLLTIPPPCWTNAAHKHNVRMLGTFITEWTDGEKICDAFLKSEATYKALANKMVEIAKHLNFDGWLVNIENQIQPMEEVGLNKEHVDRLVEFVSYLHERMHTAVPHALVIWYDSVTGTKGELFSQNALNAENRMFFDACDGIFVAYNWEDDCLQSSVLEAGDRSYDVYVGNDVFGRARRGGYGMSEDVEKVREFNLSVALFAQCWVFETQPKENFLQNEKRFWELLMTGCPVRTEPGTLPLATTFCHGNGHGYWRQGKRVSEKPWTNLSCQNVQPVQHSNTSYCTTEAYQGGGCILLQANTHATLFGRHTVPPNNHLYISITYKHTMETDDDDAAADDADAAAAAADDDADAEDDIGAADADDAAAAAAADDDDDDDDDDEHPVLHLHLGNTTLHLGGDCEQDCIHPFISEELHHVFKSSAAKLDTDSNGWNTKHYVLKVNEEKEVTKVVVDSGSHDVLIGKIQICSLVSMIEALLSTITLQTPRSPNVLTWEPSSLCHYYTVYRRRQAGRDWRLLGHTHSTTYQLGKTESKEDVLSQGDVSEGDVVPDGGIESEAEGKFVLYKVEGWHPCGVIVESNEVKTEKF